MDSLQIEQAAHAATKDLLAAEQARCADIMDRAAETNDLYVVATQESASLKITLTQQAQEFAAVQNQNAALREKLAARDEAGVDGEFSEQQMSVEDARAVVPASYPPAEVVLALQVMQGAYSGLEGDFERLAKYCKESQQFAIQEKKHAQPKQPQQALRAHENTEEDQVKTLDDAFGVNYNTGWPDDVRMALKIVQDYAKMMRDKYEDELERELNSLIDRNNEQLKTLNSENIIANAAMCASFEKQLQAEKSKSTAKIQQYMELNNKMVAKLNQLKHQKRELLSHLQYLLDTLKMYYTCVQDIDFVFESAEAVFNGAATVTAQAERVMSDKQMQTEAVPCKDDAMQTKAVPCKDNAMQTDVIPKATQNASVQTDVTDGLNAADRWRMLVDDAVAHEWQRRALALMSEMEKANKDLSECNEKLRNNNDMAVQRVHDMEHETRAYRIQVEEAMRLKNAAEVQAQYYCQMAIDVMQRTVFREQASASHADDMARRYSLEAHDSIQRCLHVQACMHELQMQHEDMRRAQEEDDLQPEEDVV